MIKLSIIKPQLATGGRIKIGLLSERRSRNGHRLPTKIDHFMLCHMDREGEDGNFRVNQAMMDKLISDGYGDSDGKLRSLPIELLSNDIDQVFPNHLEVYSSKRLACQGDGESAKRWKFGEDKKRTDEFSIRKCPCSLFRQHPDFKDGTRNECKPRATLRCFIDCEGHAVAGAVWQWRTTSMISVSRMVGSLAHVHNLLGRLVGVPLILRLQPVQTNNGTVHVCHIELRESISTTRRTLMPSMGKPIIDPQLPPETPDDEDEIAEEFFPEEEQQQDEPSKGVAGLMDKLS